MQSVHVLENITFCSLFTKRLRPYRDFNHHTVTSILHPSSSHLRHEIQCFFLSLLVFRACNDFCTVLSRTVLNTFTLQMCFCISARLYLIVFGTIYSVFSLIRPNTKKAYFFCCYYRLPNIKAHSYSLVLLLFKCL